MKKLSTLLLTFTLLTAFAQTPDWQWAQSGGGHGIPTSSYEPDAIYATAWDKEGNLFVAGQVTWYPDFDTIHFGDSVNWDNANFFLAKYDQCGNVLWVRIGGGDSNDEISGMDIDDRGNIYVAGRLTSAGSPVYINTPLKDTVINNCTRFFAKFDNDGNLLHVKTWNPPGTSSFYVEKGMLKRMKSGNLLAVVYTTALTGNISMLDNYAMYPGSHNFVIFDTLGNVVKGALIDTTSGSANVVSPPLLDENDNIYTSVYNVNLSSISILGTVFPTATPATNYLIKTDTSFTIRNYNMAYRMETFFHWTYKNGAFYCSGRHTNTAIFEWDTTTMGSGAKFTAYKVDTNLHLVWVSRPTVQSLGNPNWTYIQPGASDDNVYLHYQNRGTVTWGNTTLVTPPNEYKMAVLRLRTTDGVCIGGTLAGGGASSDGGDRVVTDEQGNAYCMGLFRSSISAVDTVYANWDGTSPDYYILKYGLGCTDTANSLDKPEPPTNLIATATGTQTIDVNWADASVYEQGFHIYRSPDGISNWVLIDSTTHNVHQYTNTGLTPNTVYWYKVAAYTLAGESAFTNTDSAKTWTVACPNTVTVSGPTSFCPGGSVMLTAPAGYSYTWSGGATSQSITVSQGGSYSVVITDNSSCTATSSAVNVTVLQPAANTINVGICPGQQYYAGGANQTTAGTYTDTLTAANGCDSVLTTILQVSNEINIPIADAVCDGSFYLFNGQQLTAAGIYADTLSAQGGCDSIVTLTLYTVSPSFTPLTQNICSGDTFYFHNTALTAAGNYNDTLQNAQGCDSVLALTLTLLQASSATVDTAIQQGQTYTLPGGSIVNTAGTYIDTVLNAAGCDSVITTELSVISAVAELRIADFGLRIYPNPANGSFTVSVSENLIGQQLTVTDVTGKQMVAVQLTTINRQLSTETFASGVYFVRVGSVVKRVMVE